MSTKGFARMRDKNEPEIIVALVAAGCSVQRISDKGVPDLLVGRGELLKLMEVKAPLGAKGGKSGRDLTPDQKTWTEAWSEHAVAPLVVRSIDEALRGMGLVPVSPGMYIECPEHQGRCAVLRGGECCCADLHVVGTYPRPENSKRKSR